MLSSTEYLNLSGLRVELEHLQVSSPNNELIEIKDYFENRISSLQEKIENEYT